MKWLSLSSSTRKIARRRSRGDHAQGTTRLSYPSHPLKASVLYFLLSAGVCKIHLVLRFIMRGSQLPHQIVPSQADYFIRLAPSLCPWFPCFLPSAWHRARLLYSRCVLCKRWSAYVSARNFYPFYFMLLLLSLLLLLLFLIIHHPVSTCRSILFFRLTLSSN